MTALSKNRSGACECLEMQIDHDRRRPGPVLQNLIPIAVAIASGCESCAEATVREALRKGSSRQHVEQTLRIVEFMSHLECLIQAVGPETTARMEKPLAAASAGLWSVK